jgi:polysaccharide biosynthesis protein PslH
MYDRNFARDSQLSASEHSKVKLKDDRPAVIIIGPPWARSGSSRVIQNQIEYYRSRGYRTLFIGVAIHWAYWRTSPIWDAFREGAGELGADRVAIAALEQKKYTATKYTATLKHGLRGTALDWIVAIGKSAQLTEEDLSFVRELPVALIHVNHVYTLGFAQRLRKQSIRGGNRVPIILETHDIQSHLLRDRGDLNPWTKRPDSLEKLLRSELKLLAQANVLVHLSVDDSEFFQAKLPHQHHVLAMPTIREAFISEVNAAGVPSPGKIDLLFVGQFYSPNLAALQWFLEKVWPLIAGRKYNLKIVGPIDKLVSGVAPQLYEMFRSCFVGEVAELAPYYRAARCVIAPMVSGSGISIKTIEALALGKPFVGTSKAFRGMPMERIEQSGIHAYDAPQSFADAIVHALCSEHEQQASMFSRAAYESVFSKSAVAAALDDAVRIATRA